MIADYRFIKCPFCNRITVASKEDTQYEYKGRNVVLVKHEKCIGYKPGYFIAEPINNIDFNFLTNNSIVDSEFLEKYLTDIYDEVIKNIELVRSDSSSVIMSSKVYESLVNRHNVTEYNHDWAEKIDITVDYFYQYFKNEQFFSEKMKPVKLIYLKSK